MTETSVMQFEIVRNVTLPFIIIPSDGTPFYLKFDSAIEPDTTTFSERVRKSKKDDNGQAPQQAPMDIATVTNLQTGEVGRLVAHSVLKSNLDEAYPNREYVGKCFQIKKQKATKGRYFVFDIVEIRLKGQNDSAKTASKK